MALTALKLAPGVPRQTKAGSDHGRAVLRVIRMVGCSVAGRRRIIAAGLVALVAGVHTASAQASRPAPERAVLVLESAEPLRPAGLAMLGSLRKTLAALAPAAVVYVEAPDVIRFPGEAQTSIFKDYLVRRYAGRRIDVIVAVGDPMTDLLLSWQSTPWPRVPIVAAMVAPAVVARARHHGNVTGLTSDLDVGRTIDAAVALFPGTRRVALVSGGDPYVGAMEQALARRPTLGVTRVLDLSLAETRRRMATLGPDTVALYGGIFMDGTGRPHTPLAALDDLATAANRPILAYSETFVGHGIVGGVVMDFEKVGRELARIAARLLEGDAAGAIPITAPPLGRPVFDARQLARWHADVARLPQGSELRFRVPTLWETHRRAAITITIVIVTQALLILALALEGRRRRRAQHELRALGAQLVSAQEEERSRVARELHDDVSQRLTLLSLQTTSLARSSGSHGETAQEQALGIATSFQAISSALHRIAYELHPAVLDQLGLVPALGLVTQELAARHGVQVRLDVANWPEDVPREVSLAFYRVTQEALRNVARHSGAREASVLLTGTPRELAVCIHDDGTGFSSSRPGPQLGLVGMKERIRQVGGLLTVVSAPGQGATVRAAVPRRGATPGSRTEGRRDVRWYRWLVG